MPAPDDPADRADPADASAPLVLGYQVLRSGATVTAASCADAGEAQLIAGELAAAGVPASVVNQHTKALGPWAGGADVQVVVPVEDADRAAEVVRRLRSGDDLEPEEEPEGKSERGGGETASDAGGRPVPLAVAAAYETAWEMQEAAAVLGSVRVRTFLPTLVPRGGRPRGSGRRFVVRVAEDDLPRARAVLEEAAAEAEAEDEPRCPSCGSRNVRKGSEGLFAGLARWFTGRSQPEGASVNAWECLRCGGSWGA